MAHKLLVDLYPSWLSQHNDISLRRVHSSNIHKAYRAIKRSGRERLNRTAIVQ